MTIDFICTKYLYFYLYFTSKFVLFQIKNILILFLFFSFWSCNSLLNQSDLEPSRVADINAIITNVISHDSVKVLKTDKEGALFCTELNKLQIYVPKKRDDLRASSISTTNPSISIDNLLGNKGAAFFSSKDSLYLMQQNSNPKLISIDTVVLQTIKCTSMEVEQIKMDLHKSFDFYQMTLPVFSKDNTIAYVELNHYCSGGL